VKIDRVYVTERAAGHSYSDEIARRCGLSPIRIPDADWYRKQVEPLEPDPVGAGKHHLLLDVFDGSFFRKCPGTRGRICCNYYVIDQATNCPFDCSYCFLQGYLNNRAIRFAVNVEDMERELAAVLTGAGPVRVGTGELSDSLALEPVTGFARRLVRFLSSFSNVTLELKTKSDAVGALPDVTDMAGQFVVGWTLSPQKRIESDERGTASLDQRLAAGEAAARKGYQIAVHLDPMVLYPGAEADYLHLVGRVFDRHRKLAWMSMAGFRYETELKNFIERRFPDSHILDGEFSRCGDGKHRYLFPDRIRLFRSVARLVRERSPETPLYFCMEDQETWTCSIGPGSWRSDQLSPIMKPAGLKGDRHESNL